MLVDGLLEFVTVVVFAINRMIFCCCSVLTMKFKTNLSSIVELRVGVLASIFFIIESSLSTGAGTKTKASVVTAAAAVAEKTSVIVVVAAPPFVIVAAPAAAAASVAVALVAVAAAHQFFLLLSSIPASVFFILSAAAAVILVLVLDRKVPLPAPLLREFVPLSLLLLLPPGICPTKFQLLN